MPENKFKAGDKVVAKKDTYGLTEGETYTVRSEARATGDNGQLRWVNLVELRSPVSDDGSFIESSFDLAAPVFKVGDRVRIASGPNNGGFGKVGDVGIVQFTSLNDCSVKFETGSRSSESWYVAYKHLEPVAAAEQQQPLTIQAGRFYKTRDGRKVGPMKRWDCCGSDYQWESGGLLWKDDGENYDKGSKHTIVAEWQDEPNDYLTRVLVDTDYPTKHTPAIVCRLDNGQPLPARKPHVHASVADASKEATRLAKANPGREFGVYKMVHTVTEQRTYDHEWMRLASTGEKFRAIKEIRDLTGMTLKGAKDAVEHWQAVNAA